MEFHQNYLLLKKKFKSLLHENESFQEELRKSEHKLLRISRDKSFLLDRLLQYEKEPSSSDSADTMTSDSDSEISAQNHVVKKFSPYIKNEPVKNKKHIYKKKSLSNQDNQKTFVSDAFTNNANEVKRKKYREATTSKSGMRGKSDPAIIPVSDLPMLKIVKTTVGEKTLHKAAVNKIARVKIVNPKSCSTTAIKNKAGQEIHRLSNQQNLKKSSNMPLERTNQKPAVKTITKVKLMNPKHCSTSGRIIQKAAVNTISKVKILNPRGRPPSAMKNKTGPEIHRISNVQILKKSSNVVPVVTETKPWRAISLNKDSFLIGHGDGHMTPQEIERHLEAKHSLRDLMPEKTPLTLPNEIFSNDQSEAESDVEKYEK